MDSHRRALRPPLRITTGLGHAAALSCLLLGACSGLVEEAAGPADDFTNIGEAADGEQPGAAERCDPDAKSFAPARLWQLTDEQYVNVVKDVFGIELTGSDAQIVSAAVSEHYTNYSEGITVGLQVVPSYQLAARNVARRVVDERERLLGSSEPSAEDVEAFVRDRVSRAFRRPLDTDEVEALVKIYRDALPDADVGLKLVMEAALQAPSFLYRTELGEGNTQTGPVTLTPHEIASALSFLMLETVPDDRLWEKAEDGSLADPDVLREEVERLLERDDVRKVLTRKASFWLGLEALPLKLKDPTLFPEFTGSVRESLYRSVQAFLNDVLWNGEFEDLFDSSKVYANRELAEVYDLGEVEGDDLTELEVEGRSAGILTQPGFLAAVNKWSDRGDPIHRGLYVYEAFVCGSTLPPPPADAFDIGASLSGSEREKVDKRANMPACAACHALFDPLGLTFEAYDAMGRFSEYRYTEFDPLTGITSWKESDTRADSSSELAKGLGEGLAGPVDGLEDLADKLKGQSERVAGCAAKQLAEYALGYNPEARKSCELKSVKERFAESGSFEEFFLALATSPAFVTRDALAE